MIKMCTFIVALIVFACTALCQTTGHKYPAAVAAPDKRPEICSPEPLQTPLPTWVPGTLEVDMVVGSDGKVAELAVMKSSYGAQETETASAALREWRFTPAYYHGYYVNVHIAVEVTVAKDSVQVRIPDFAKHRGCKSAPFAIY
jgi:hypothetical protein